MPNRFIGVLLATAALAAFPVFGLTPAAAAEQRTGHADRAVPPPQTRVDINHASLAELMKVPGMTRSWAQRIVRFRPYRAKSDLVERGVLPSDVYERIKDNVVAHRAKPQT